MKDKVRSLLPAGLIISLIAAFVAIIVSTSIGIAAYTNSRHAQRTIAPYDDLSGGYRFSSTALGAGGSAGNVKIFYTTSDSTPVSADFSISNYPPNKQNLPNEVNITYTLLARLVRYDDGTHTYVPVDASYISTESLGDYKVTITKSRTAPPESVTLGGTGGEAILSDNSFGGTLTGGVISADSYMATFSTNFTSDPKNLYLELTATPTSPSDLPALSGIIKPEKRIAGATNSWTGSFTDDTVEHPAAYDGFNYLVSGMGSGTCTLSWEESIVALSLVSQMELMAIDGAEKVGSSISFPVDSDEVSRYALQFYKVNVTSQTWAYMNETAVTLVFVPASA
ncbi:MAG: hypothetical protein J6126_05590 [Clostridia bacterium]|nr:hypothetical protein [Clostridia bacterium]